MDKWTCQGYRSGKDGVTFVGSREEFDTKSQAVKRMGELRGQEKGHIYRMGRSYLFPVKK
jgi:hypothetical protein